MKSTNKKIIKALGTLLLLLFLACLGIVIVVTELKVSRLVPGGLGESFSTRIFAAPAIFLNDSEQTLAELKERLLRIGYVSTTLPTLAPGQFSEKAGVLQVFLNGFETPAARQDPGLFKFSHTLSKHLEIHNEQGEPVPQITLQPEIISELSGPKKVRRDPANWDEIPPALSDAVVAVEDRRFYQHFGIDPRAIARALWTNVRKLKRLQGGSTITQQLAKNFFLTQKPTMSRKLVEAVFAVYLDFRFSKQQILTLYLNHIYMGQEGRISIAGVKSAARFYFDKELRDLNLPESALLAGIIRSPYRYNPRQNPQQAQRRRDLVIHLMEREGLISAQAAEEAIKTPMIIQADKSTENVNEFDYFVAEVVRTLLPDYGEDMLFRYGLQIYTTVDPLMQRAAFRAVKKLKTQAALLSLDPQSGNILALIGGTDYRKSQFNRATQALRQPGSSFKPFTFGAALEKGLTPATLLSDEPRAYSSPDGKIWAPKNYDGTYRGEVTLRKALADSLNGATIDLAEKTGLDRIIRYARNLGIVSPLPRNLTMALGSAEVSLLELSAAYAPFVNGGFRIKPVFVVCVLDSEGSLLELISHQRQPVLDPAHAYLMISLLETTVLEGTAKSLDAYGWKHPTAAKTGTTNDGKDAWFIGMTRDLLTGVWVGDDDAKALNLAGAKDALPVWFNFMSAVYANRPAPSPFEQPQGILKVKVDPLTGTLARSGCPSQKEELFVIGTEPTSYCPLHAGGIKGFFQRLFGRSGSKKDVKAE